MSSLCDGISSFRVGTAAAGSVCNGRYFRLGRRNSRAFLFSLFQRFVNTTHGFLSRVEDRTTFDWRKRPSSSSRFWSNACVSLA